MIVSPSSSPSSRIHRRASPSASEWIRRDSNEKSFVVSNARVGAAAGRVDLRVTAGVIRARQHYGMNVFHRSSASTKESPNPLDAVVVEARICRNDRKIPAFSLHCQQAVEWVSMMLRQRFNVGQIIELQRQRPQFK